MGRPPIGREAMTNAERQRRFIGRLKAGKDTVSNDIKFPEGYIPADRSNYDLSANQISDWLRGELAAGRLNANAMKVIGYNAMHLAGFKPEPDQVPPLKKKIEMMGETIDRLEAEIQRSKEAHPATGKAPWTRAQYMGVLKCLHPDRIKGVSVEELDTAFRLLEQTKAHLMMGEAEEQAKKAAQRQAEHRHKQNVADAAWRAKQKAKRDAAKKKRNP